jgi:hypothetical protein
MSQNNHSVVASGTFYVHFPTTLFASSVSCFLCSVVWLVLPVFFLVVHFVRNFPGAIFEFAIMLNVCNIVM